MTETRNRPRLISRGGQLRLYALVVVIALLAGAYSGIVYYFMGDDTASILQRNGITPESDTHRRIVDIVEMGFAATTLPIAVVAVFALCGWGLCLFGWTDLPLNNPSVTAPAPVDDPRD